MKNTEAGKATRRVQLKNMPFDRFEDGVGFIHATGYEKDMKKTINLLNEVVKMGFSREKALRDIDASLDEELRTENRKPLMEEEIPDQLYEDILFGFRCEAEEP